MELTVGQLSSLTSVTVRTLHHYDEIGLLTPSARSSAGYRLYTDEDAARLSRVLFYRELGFPLAGIVELLADPTRGTFDHLRRQRELLTERAARLDSMIAALDKEMEAHTMGHQLTPQERLEVWGDFSPEEYEAEVEERWGDTDAYKVSAQRTAAYTADDWRRMKEESDMVNALFVTLITGGVAADSVEAMDAAQAHREHIDRWFYPCSADMHVGLADMYVADPRFTATYEALAPGLAAYVSDAIHANAIR